MLITVCSQCGVTYFDLDDVIFLDGKTICVYCVDHESYINDLKNGSDSPNTEHNVSIS